MNRNKYNLIEGILMKKKRIGLLALLLVLSFTLMACGGNESSGSAEDTGDTNNKGEKENKSDFPSRGIDIIAGGGPGGGTDLFSRAVGRELSEILDVNINIINMPGAAGSVASQELAKRPADGYTIMPTTSDLQINIASGRTDNYLEEFDALARLHEDTYLFWVKKDSKYSDIDKLIKEAKDNPGQIVIGGAHSDGLDDLTVRLFEDAAGVDLNYTPYEETGMFQSDLVGGHIDVIIDELGASIGLLEGGEIEPILVFASERLEDFPDVPTTVEKGLDVTNGMDRGFVIKSDVPEEIKEILQKAFEEVAASERYQEFAKSEYLDLKDGWLDADDYNASLVSEVEIYSSMFD